MIAHIDEGFDFLGWNFRKYKVTLLIKPSHKSIKSITQNIKTIVSKAKVWTQDQLIQTLNPIIRGWTNYHRHIVAKDTFRKLDTYIWQVTWQWGKRRHPNKGHKWIADKYWHSEGNRNWAFRTKDTKLLKFSDAKIRRHSMPKLDATLIWTETTSSKERNASRGRHHGFKPDFHFSLYAALNGL